MIPSDDDDRDVLAGEYVLGLLDAAEVEAVASALRDDPDLAGRVRFWEERLAPLATALPSTHPDPTLWARIERDLARPAGERAAGRVLRPARHGPMPSRAGRLWHSVPLWRGVAALATAACFLLGLALERALRGGGSEPPTRFFAVMQARDAAGQETGPGWLIQVADDGTVRSLPLGRTEPGAGRALQLWTLWDAARGPVSLGVLPPGGAVRLPSDRLPVIGGGQLFEITLEPEAGSPTGRPTGRILFIGRASQAANQAL